MKRLLFTLIMALLFFGILNFVYCNLDAATFAYPVVFKFNIPLIMPNGYESSPLPLGFILLITFCLGMVFIAVMEAVPSIYKSLELRSKNKKIRELERELNVSRQLAGVGKNEDEKPKT